MFLKYILLGFAFAAGIGPVNIETAKRGLTGNIKHALYFYLGNVIIDAFYIIIIMLGVSLLIENAIIKVVLGIFGICYLSYLGISDIRDFSSNGIFSKNGIKAKKKNLHPALEGILVNLANPTAIASWLAFYSLSADDFKNSNLNFVAVIIGAILVGCVIVLITHFFKGLIGEKIMKFISLASGIILIGFALLFSYNFFI